MGLGLGLYLRKVDGIRYVDFIAPGLGAAATMNGASFEVTFSAFVKIRLGRVYDAVMATLLSVEDVGLGGALVVDDARARLPRLRSGLPHHRRRIRRREHGARGAGTPGHQ